MPPEHQAALELLDELAARLAEMGDARHLARHLDTVRLHVMAHGDLVRALHDADPDAGLIVDDRLQRSGKMSRPG